MKNTVYMIDQFKENIMFEIILAILGITISIVLLCICRKKKRPEGSKLFIAWWIVILILCASCGSIISLIPAFIDIHTGSIDVVEVLNTTKSYNAHSINGLVRGRIDFTNVDGEKS